MPEADVAIATGRPYLDVLTPSRAKEERRVPMKAIDSLPAEPLHGDIILALNDSEADMAVMPVSYYEEIHIHSMVIMTDDYASVVGFDGNEWVELTRTTPDSDEEFDPEGVIDEWMQETHPELYDDPEFEVTSKDYDLEQEDI